MKGDWQSLWFDLNMIDLSLNKLLDDALNPLAMIWFILLLAAWRFWKLKAYKSSAGLGAVSVLVWFLGASPLAGMILGSLERPYLETDSSALDGVDAVVCLGGGMYPQEAERLSFTINESGDRYLTAFDLIETGVTENLVMGGSDYQIRGKPSSEGVLIQQWRQRWNMTKGTIHLLSDSLSTRDEAERVGRLMEEKGWRKVALVTSAWHMERSLDVFKRYGVNAIPVGCDFSGVTSTMKKDRWKIFPQSAKLQLVHFYLHEIVGYYYYKLRGWI